MLKIIFIFLIAINYVFASSKCPDINDLKKYNQHYYGITSRMMTFEEAKLFAESKGGYLAIPNDGNENTFLKDVLGGRKGAWIGVYDPSYNSNHSYSVGQKKDTKRFKSIKNELLTYSYWESSQPDNLIENYDTYNGVQRVSPLGEHWVAMDGNSGKWWDYGNHLKRGEAKFYALLEFDTVPTCFEDLSSNVVDDFTNKKCSTQIWDSRSGNIENSSIFDCQKDIYGNDYCPSSLSQCSQEWDYEDGYSVSGIRQVVDYALKEKVFRCPSDNYILLSKYHDDCPSCINHSYHEVKCSTDGTINVLHEFRFKSNNSYDSGRLIQTYNQSSISSDVSRKLLGDIGTNCNYLVYYSRNCGSLNCTYNFSIDSNCAGPSYSISETAPIPYTFNCPSGYTETIGSETSKGECKRTREYTYYNYLCNNSINLQGYNYSPINTGGFNSTNPNPPKNNCKREKFTCQANKDRPCSFVDNQWQCSPFPCIGKDDIIPEGDIEGHNDKNNAGWSEDGTCNGQIYIFNGKDRRCRSSDKFFGLVGGGCCNKDKVFLGLIACKESEKVLAKQNKAQLCTEIGEYCSKKIRLGFTKICIQKSKSYCCFGSKLARFVHEQGREQLGISWGSAESPQCRGFTPEEFQKLDFSKIDLTGAFDLPQINQQVLTNKINSTVSNFKNMLGNGNN